MGPLDIVVHHSLFGAHPATSANFGIVFTNVTDQMLELIGGEGRHETAGTDGGAVTLSIGKVASGVAKGSATAMVASSINLKGAADTKQSIVPHATLSNRLLSPGQSVVLNLTGTPTSLAGLHVSLLFRPYQ